MRSAPNAPAGLLRGPRLNAERLDGHEAWGRRGDHRAPVSGQHRGFPPASYLLQQ